MLRTLQFHGRQKPIFAAAIGLAWGCQQVAVLACQMWGTRVEHYASKHRLYNTLVGTSMYITRVIGTEGLVHILMCRLS